LNDDLTSIINEAAENEGLTERIPEAEAYA
jgi:hypothetical protein